MTELKGKIVRAAPPDYQFKRPKISGITWAASGSDIIRCPNCNEVITAAGPISSAQPQEYQCHHCGAVSKFPA